MQNGPPLDAEAEEQEQEEAEMNLPYGKTQTRQEDAGTGRSVQGRSSPYNDAIFPPSPPPSRRGSACEATVPDAELVEILRKQVTFLEEELNVREDMLVEKDRQLAEKDRKIQALENEVLRKLVPLRSEKESKDLPYRRTKSTEEPYKRSKSSEKKWSIGFPKKMPHIFKVSQDSSGMIDQVAAMGFSLAQAKTALQHTNSVQDAIEWLLVQNGEGSSSSAVVGVTQGSDEFIMVDHKKANTKPAPDPNLGYKPIVPDLIMFDEKSGVKMSVGSQLLFPDLRLDLDAALPEKHRGYDWKLLYSMLLDRKSVV